MKLIARSRAAFFKLCGKYAPLSFPRAPQEFQRNSPAKTQAAARVDALRSFLYDESVGRLAQLVRAPALQAGGRRFEPCTAHHLSHFFNAALARVFAGFPPERHRASITARSGANPVAPAHAMH